MSLSHMTIAHVYRKKHTRSIHNESSKMTKSHMIKKRTNNKISFVEFILDSWQFKIVATRS